MGKQRDVDRKILKMLKEGRRTLGYLSDQIDYSKQHISHRLEVLRAHGDIEKIHEPTALYQIKEESDTKTK